MKVDNNCNFKYKLINLPAVGASDNPCSETHAGPVPFSDPESRALRDFYEARKDDIQVYLAFHSYGQYVLSPWGYTSDHVHNYDQLMQIGKFLKCISITITLFYIYRVLTINLSHLFDLGNAAAAAIRQRYGTEYTVGSTAETLCKNFKIFINLFRISTVSFI